MPETKRRSYESKKMIKYSALGLVAVPCNQCFSSMFIWQNQPVGRKPLEVGTVGTTKPFSYEEKDGKLTGYEIEVLREIFKGSDKYEVNFNKTEWSSVFAGLDSDRFQIRCQQHQLLKRAGRKIPLSKSICS